MGRPCPPKPCFPEALKDSGSGPARRFEPGRAGGYQQAQDDRQPADAVASSLAAERRRIPRCLTSDRLRQAVDALLRERG